MHFTSCPPGQSFNFLFYNPRASSLESDCHRHFQEYKKVPDLMMGRIEITACIPSSSSQTLQFACDDRWSRHVLALRDLVERSGLNNVGQSCNSGFSHQILQLIGVQVEDTLFRVCDRVKDVCTHPVSQTRRSSSCPSETTGRCSPLASLSLGLLAEFL